MAWYDDVKKTLETNTIKNPLDSIYEKLHGGTPRPEAPKIYKNLDEADANPLKSVIPNIKNAFNDVKSNVIVIGGVFLLVYLLFSDRK